MARGTVRQLDAVRLSSTDDDAAEGPDADSGAAMR